MLRLRRRALSFGPVMVSRVIPKGGLFVLRGGLYGALATILALEAFYVLCSNRQQIVFSAFDPVQGRKGELARVETGSPPYSFWDLSPDGSRIAFDDIWGTDRIRIVPLTGGKAQELALKGWLLISSLGWSPDGTGLFVTGLSSKANSLLQYVSLNGEAQTLHTAATWLEKLVASPDGRYLAFGQVIADSNAWMIENFP